MGHTLKNLAEKEASSRTIFHHRFVVEACEQFHVHYRNLRILLSKRDFISMAEGMRDALDRWKKRGSPDPGDIHIELCRKEVAIHPVDDNKIKVNLNDNLYNKNEGKIFAEGSGIDEPVYIHIKWRDLRLECTIDEFLEFSTVMQEASKNLTCKMKL